ncbi:CPBP family intramembrane metalloprotease [Erwinia sp. CPCC 100877]|nr:CPBP family intramembrane metalloprotease [Erwinia sp. CPCC 100877]
MSKQVSIKKQSLIMIFVYALAFFSPYLFQSLSNEQLITATTVTYILGAILMSWFYLRYKQSAITQVEANGKLTSPVFVFLLGISGIVMAIIIQAIVFNIEAAITGEQSTSQNTQDIISLILTNPLFSLATVIGGPFMEEFIFRRSMIGLLESYTGFWLAAIISSALFSLIHMDGHFFVYFFMGFFFALLYKVTGKIWTSIIAHCGMNALVVVAQLILYYSDIQLPS